jgi:RNA polymerase sigma-70 factor (ECF subfamily)
MLEDKKLLTQWRRGSREAVQRIYEKYHDDLLTLAANLLRDPNRAEDVVQNVFVALVRLGPGLRLRRSLKGYLATAVANAARDHFRRRTRERSAVAEGTSRQTVDGEGPVRAVANAEDVQKLRLAVEKLPYEQREVVMLRVHADMKFREIAKHQKVSVKTALSRYRYGLDKLRSMLNGEVPDESG